MQTRAGTGNGDHGAKVNTAKVTHKDEDEYQEGKMSPEEGKVDGGPGTMPRDNMESPEAPARRLAAVRERIRDAGAEAREEAKDWIREKRDDMDEMREALRDAHKDGRLREELTDQAKKRTGRFQELWNKYGVVAIGTYFGVFVATLGSLYVVYDYGLVTELPSGAATAIEKMKEFMKNTPEWSQNLSNRLFDAMADDRRARSLVLAWATCKIAEPLRIIATIAITPRVARALGRVPPPDAFDNDTAGQVEGSGGGGKEEGAAGGR